MRTGPRVRCDEQQVLALVRDGLTNAQLCAQIGISERTFIRWRVARPALSQQIIAIRAELATDKLAPCGTPSAYQRHCRRGETPDAACRAANARAQAELFERRRGKPIPPHVPHGRASTYRNWHCRCRPCTDAHTAYCRPHVRAYRERRAKDLGLPTPARRQPRKPPSTPTDYLALTVAERAEQAFARGETISWVMNAHGLSYEQAKAIRDAWLGAA